MMNTGRVEAIRVDDRESKYTTPTENKKVKKFDAELQAGLTGNPPIHVAYMPGSNIWTDSAKGSGAATHQA